MLGVDRLMSTALAVTTMIGNSVAVLAIAKWEDAFDRAKFDAYSPRSAPGQRLWSGLILLVPLPVSLSVGLRLNEHGNGFHPLKESQWLGIPAGGRNGIRLYFRVWNDIQQVVRVPLVHEVETPGRVQLATDHSRR